MRKARIFERKMIQKSDFLRKHNSKKKWEFLKKIRLLGDGVGS